MHDVVLADLERFEAEVSQCLPDDDRAGRDHGRPVGMHPPEAADLLHGHVGGLDVLARGLKAAAAILEDGTLEKAREARYAGWSDKEGKAMLTGKRSLDQIAARVEKQNINPQPVSGQQEYLENLINRFV